MHAGVRAGLYIHIPFCRRKCPYCDFYSLSDLSLQKPFVRSLIGEMALVREMDLIGPPPFEFDTLYLGGGTPSVMTPTHIRQIIDNARNSFRFSADVEATLEANPSSMQKDHLAAYRAAGVNRLNIGVQSFHDDHLRFLGRLHTSRQALSAVKRAREAGFTNLGIDLIYGIPKQSEALWRSDLQQAVALQPEHLSCYILTYEPGTPLTRALQEDGFTPMSDTRVAALFAQTVFFLNDHGYSQYEISSFAREDGLLPGVNQSRHNRKYWSHIPYLGLGPGAHSFYGSCRAWNLSDLEAYMAAIQAGRLAVADSEVLTPRQQMIETIYLGLRRTEGIVLENFEGRFGVKFGNLFASLLDSLEEKGLLRRDPERIALTIKGMLFADRIAAMFVDQPLPAPWN